jgi:hypothetical protein
MHMLVKTLCTCSCSMVLMMRVRMSQLPICVSDCKGNQRQGEGLSVSRFLTTKLPSALLMAVVQLQHTRCPRFRRGTFGYGVTTSPMKRGRVGVRVFMRMHVSMPKLPECICYAVHAQKLHLFYFTRLRARPKRISLGTRSRLDL